MWYSFYRWLVKQSRKPKTIVLFLVCTIGMLLILINVNNVIQGIGISLLASGIVSLISIFFINNDDSEKTVQEWGLEHVYNTRGEMNASCGQYMSHAKTIKAIGFGFRSLRDSQESGIIRILRKGGSVQFITMKPDCEALQLRGKDEGQDISHSVIGLIEWAKVINSENHKGKIEIRYHEHLPLDFMFLMNNRLFTGPYEYGKISQQTISFEYNVSGMAYEYYEKYFDRLWNDQKFCTDALA